MCAFDAEKTGRGVRREERRPMSLFWQAFTVMVFGMAVVFAFLAILILAVNATARIVHRIEGVPEEETPEPATDAREGRRRAAAIAVALRTFRRKP
jgi:sodium pump decarboxylase gamma subunit